MEPPSKRRRLSTDDDNVADSLEDADTFPRSLSHPVSPPARKRARPQAREAEVHVEDVVKPGETVKFSSSHLDKKGNQRIFTSPFQLTWIQDLPEAANTDAVTLRDLLGDPLIAECWEFNYLHDINFLMAAFDQDIRDLVQVHLVHGFWKKEDPNRLMLQVSLNDRLQTGPWAHA